MAVPPERIGPYRILEPIGAGGMGQVFLAYDERLDRKVAIKQIRPGSGSPESRERFRREARLAARLNHPAIVQVYDVLGEGDVDSIVMEHVDGISLRRLLDAGPLPPARAAALARELAEALDEAHRQGVVHRDVKSENVLVLPSGRAKLTDFGIAKRLDRAEDPLTREGAVPGTCRAMSPEQARGEPVDFRSDLFSLGVLLYEMLTGVSPFSAGNDLATLQRILRDRPPSVCELVPGVPGELSALVDHLLQKDPRLRPRNAGEVARTLGGTAMMPSVYDSRTVTSPAVAEPASAGTYASPGARLRLALGIAGLLLALALGLAAYRALRKPGEPVYVAVLPPEIAEKTGTGELGLLASAIHVSLLRTLLSLAEISPRDPQEAGAVSGSAAEVARAVAADEVVRSRLECRPEACRVVLSRLRADGSLVWTESFEVPTDELSLVASAAAYQIRRAYTDHPPRRGSPGFAASGADLRTFLELRSRFNTPRDASFGPLLAELEALRRRSPRFLEAYLLEIDVARHRFYDSRDPADLERAVSLIHRARELAPGDPRPAMRWFYLALDTGNLADAKRALAEMERVEPGDVAVLDARAQLLHARGKTAEALETLRSAAHRHPAWKRLLNLARMEHQSGEIGAARGHLHHLLQRAPGNPEGLSLLAQIELINGDPKRAVTLYRELLRRSPGTSERSNLGLAYFFLGRYAEAAETFRSVLTTDPKNPFFALNLADATLLMGHETEARSLYAGVLERIAADPAATGPQFLTVKAQALAHLGRGPEAAAAVQEALRLAPDDGSTAYEASLVYALLGEDNSALVNADRARQRGFEPRWFTFPWFKPLHRHPDFQALLRQPPR